MKQLPRTISNTEDVRQLVRASGSVAANWIEADEALSKKDFLMRTKICRKEAKESRLFLRLIDAGLNKSSLDRRDVLAAEARESDPDFLGHHLKIQRMRRAFMIWRLNVAWDLGIGIWNFSKE